MMIFQFFIIIFFIHIILSTPVTKKKTNHPSELFVSDEDKHCYACKDANDECMTPCHWTQRCYIKAKHANATINERQCTTQQWARELLADGCITYMQTYWCMCSSDMCNGGDLDSIRGFEDCSKNPCQDGTICLDTKEGFNCICAPWQDDCTRSYQVGCSCKNGGRCIMNYGSYGCECPYGYTGINCETLTGLVPEELLPLLLKEAAVDNAEDDSESSPCAGEPCGLDGVCIPMPDDKYVCLCQNRVIAAKSCDEARMDPCAPHNPCRNGRCISNERGGFQCKCRTGWSGRRCDQVSSYCAKYNPCLNNGTCHDDGESYRCQCSDNFMGHRCERMEKSCSSPQCFNGGVCVNTATSFKCICPIDFEGQRCDLKWNDCASHSCQHGSTCIDGIASYTCQCAKGFTGKYCEINIDDCRMDSCMNNGTCIDLVHDYRCQCLPGFTGRMCQYDLRKCNDTLCRNYGTCYMGFDGYAQCHCNQIYTGVFCETRVHPCFPNPCTNGGTCVARGNKIACLCRNKFTGNQCEKHVDV
ncbi:unnamed protein product [Rotaria sordida]|uniref:EGF-like domain-containing protein n=1 Tax=Rotaria sordida TaxID=392033 RepID=A0A814JHA9_9BILA|nr:unnamed protein product [Rotaria sordida]CAF1035868.1 unnamed protein product [Rotaria sordida]